MKRIILPLILWGMAVGALARIPGDGGLPPLMTGTAKSASEEIRVRIETDPHGEIEACDNSVSGALTIQGEVFDIVEVCSRGAGAVIEAEGSEGTATIDGSVDQQDDGSMSLKGQLIVKSGDARKSYRINLNER